MKKIESVTPEDKEVLRAPLEGTTPQSINTISDLRMVDKICTKIEDSQDTIELEDAEFSFLKERMDDYTNWSPTARKQILVAFGKLEKLGKS